MQIVSVTDYSVVANQGSPANSGEGFGITIYGGYKALASGLCVGLSSLAAGLAIGVTGDAGIRATAQKDIFVGVVLILIFGEALGLYGLIVAIILSNF